jgi:cytochrome c-type biogenesis protein CcmF
VALCAVIFWGTFFPLVSELFTGEEASLAAPWFDSYTTPVAVALVLFTGVGPLLAWRRVTWESARRVFLWPALAAVASLLTCVALTDADEDGWALAIFSLAAFTLVALAQELWRGAAARRRLAGGSVPGSMLSVVARNRRRYGGYLAHAGLALLLVGIAASSSFQTNRDVRLAPGESATVGDYRLTYERPTVDVTNERIAFGAVLDVRRDGERFAVLAPTRNYFRPNGEPTGPISSYFAGEATSEVGLEAGLRQDFWTAVQPDIRSVERTAAAADRGFRSCLRGAPGTPPGCAALGAAMRAAADDPTLRPVALAQISRLQGETIRRVAEGFGTAAAPATFRVIVNPMVSWLWIGALVALAGALIAVWPAPGARRRRVTSLAAARVGRGLSRA